MTTFDKREEAFEKKFAIDEELKFKAEARRNRLIGLWAAEKLGITGDAATAYAREAVASAFAEGGDKAVVARLARERKLHVDLRRRRHQRYGRSSRVRRSR